MERIDLSKIVIARKLTDVEYVMQKRKIDEQIAIKRVLRKGEEGERQVSSHLRFKDNLKRFLEYFPEESQLIIGEQLTRELVRPDSLLIAFGGDDFFKYASQFVEDEYFIGVNGERLTSNGALTPFDSESFGSLLPSLENSQFNFEEWTRLTASINGKVLPKLAVSEIFIGSPFRKRSSKYALEYADLKERLSNSGLLVATGAGSTGWYHAAASCEHQEAEIFPRTSSEARFYTTEAFFGRLNAKFPRRGSISANEVLTVTNTSHFPEIVSIDSIADYPFRRGTIAKINIAEKSLRVVTGI